MSKALLSNMELRLTDGSQIYQWAERDENVEKFICWYKLQSWFRRYIFLGFKGVPVCSVVNEPRLGMGRKDFNRCRVYSIICDIVRMRGSLLCLSLNHGPYISDLPTIEHNGDLSMVDDRLFETLCGMEGSDEYALLYCG